MRSLKFTLFPWASAEGGHAPPRFLNMMLIK